MTVGNNVRQPASQDDLLWRHLKSVPAFRALLRAVEARFYRQVEIPEPILDLGCGDGHFAQMTFDQPLLGGVDPWWGPLNKARDTGLYRLNVQALGDALPFPDGTFASVISNSVLEHIPEIQPVLNEAARVLRPGGRLVVTMPSHLFTEHLGGAQLLRPLGLAGHYRRFFNQISRHAHTDPPEEWAGRFAQAGFKVRRWQTYFSKGALRTLEIGHLQGLPSAVLHFLTGHWILGPWSQNLALTERWVRPYYEETFPEEGAYLFFVAEKVAEYSIQSDLPPQQPFTLSDFRQPLQPVGGPSQPLLPPVINPGQPVSEPPDVQRAAVLEPPVHQPVSTPIITGDRAVAATAPSSQQGGPAWSKVIVVAALVLAVLGQSILSAGPERPAAGVSFYMAALALLGGAVFIGRRGLPHPGSITGQRFLFPAALLLALLAQRQAGTSLYDGRPLLALLLWFGAIGLGYFSLRRSPSTPIVELPPSHSPLTSHTSHLTSYVLPILLFIAALVPRLIMLADHPFILNGIEAGLGLEAAAVVQGGIRNPFAAGWLTNPTLPLYLLALPIQFFGQTVVGIRILSALVGALTVVVIYLVGSRLWEPAVGLVAAILLAGSHFHLQYSRLGMTNVWDPFWVLLALALIAVARRRGSRQSWLLAGLAVGLNAYFYTPSHLMPLILLALAGYFLLAERETVWQQGRHMLAAVALALLVALPQIVYYNATPGVFTQRASELGILHTTWLTEETVRTGRSALALLWEQLWRSMLAFNYSLDTSSNYNPGIPLLRFWPSLFFALGLGLALIKVRQLRYSLLLIWLGTTILFAGALLLSPPDSHRLLVAAPAVHLLAAVAIVWFWRKLLLPLLPESFRPYQLAALAALALLLVAGDLVFYFGRYRQEHRFGDPNTEVAHEMAKYLENLEGEWLAFFHGSPAMYVDFPTLRFLAPDFQPGQNLFDVHDVSSPLPATPRPDTGLIFLFHPERQNEIEMVRQSYPGGTLQTVNGVFAAPLFYAYEVPD